MTETGNLSRRGLWMQRLSDEVVRGILGMVRAGTLTRGRPLPDRATLAAEFVTSEGVVDRAIEKLLAQGMVRRQADNSYVITAFPGRADPFELPQTDLATQEDVLEILELRIGIECEAAALAAIRRTETTLAAIRRAEQDYRAAATDRTTPARSDFRFHLAIGEASGNKYYRDLIEYLGPLFIPRMRMSMMRSGAESDAALERSLGEHRAIVAAIEAGDAGSARSLMRDHLSRNISVIRSFDPQG